LNIPEKENKEDNMNYNEFVKALGDLYHDAEFCLMDVSERISAGEKTIEFLITEDEGYERISRKSGKNTYRTRVYLSCPSVDNSRIEINEDSKTGLDKSTISSWGFSVHEMFLFNPALFEGAYQSLKQKIAVVGDSSKTLLEAAMGEQITKLITARLQGEDVSADIRSMLDEHIKEMMLTKVVPRIREISLSTPITRLGIKNGDSFSWDFDREGENGDFNLKIRWKSLHYGYQNRNEQVWLIRQEADSFCVRDAFLFSVNLPTFGDQIANRIEMVSTLDV
jgi:hypothetical protein